MQKIIILNFGSQTTQLIGRRVRELNTFCEIVPYNRFPQDDPDVIGVILSGSPLSVYDPDSFQPDLSGIIGKYPVVKSAAPQEGENRHPVNRMAVFALFENQ